MIKKTTADRLAAHVKREAKKGWPFGQPNPMAPYEKKEEVRDYDEPWYVQLQWSDYNGRLQIVGRKGGFCRMPPDWEERACDCVNAMAGKDPEKSAIVDREKLLKFLSDVTKGKFDQELFDYLYAEAEVGK